MINYGINRSVERIVFEEKNKIIRRPNVDDLCFCGFLLVSPHPNDCFFFSVHGLQIVFCCIYCTANSINDITNEKKRIFVVAMFLIRKMLLSNKSKLG